MSALIKKYPQSLYNTDRMYRRPSKRAQRIRLAITYTAMVLGVALLTTVVLLFVLGYRIENGKGLEQGALLQFNTQPTGATVSIDGKLLGSNTPNKSTVVAGTHTVTMSKPGYDTWSKTVNTPAGTLTWLDYALLIPQKIVTNATASYKTLVGMLPSPDNKRILLQQTSADPDFQLVDITGTSPKTTTVSVPSPAFTAPATAGDQSFSISSWDPNGRYVLLQHTYDSKNSEWILFDTQNPAASKNITASLGANFSKLVFSGTNGTALYGLDTDNTIRKIDLGANTLSGPLVSNVTDFNLYQTTIITYVGTNDKGQAVAGIYQDGDTESDVLKTADTADGLHITTTSYYGNNYVAISSGDQVDILQGSYPHSAQDSSSLQPYARFSFSAGSVANMSFSPRGDYLTVQKGTSFETYNIEHMYTSAGTVPATTVNRPMQWLDQAYLYADYDGQLTIREFDGTNSHAIATVAPGFSATLTQNQHYLYSIGRNSQGDYTLQQTNLLVQ